MARVALFMLLAAGCTVPTTPEALTPTTGFDLQAPRAVSVHWPVPTGFTLRCRATRLRGIVEAVRGDTLLFRAVELAGESPDGGSCAAGGTAAASVAELRESGARGRRSSPGKAVAVALVVVPISAAVLVYLCFRSGVCAYET